MIKTEKLRIWVGFGTDRGVVREINEDSFCVFVPYPGSEKKTEFQAVLGVADGMGGYKAGDLSSHFITDRINEMFIQGRYKDKYEDINDMPWILKNVILEINRELYTTSKKDKSLMETGSTLTLGIIKDSVLHLAHVGDSRCYCIQGGEISQLTKDHSWVAEQVSSGAMSREEAIRHPKNNILTQAIGFDPNVEPQILSRKITKGEKYLFCSDGLTNHVFDEEIKDAATTNSNPQKACNSLIELAKQRGGKDNITVVLGIIADETLKETVEEDAGRLKSKKSKRSIKLPRINRILYGVLVLALAIAIFFSGNWYNKAQHSKRMDALVAQAENYYQYGHYQKARDVIQIVLQLDPKNKKAQEILLKIQNTSLQKKEVETPKDNK